MTNSFTADDTSANSTLAAFHSNVIDRISLNVGGRQCDYRAYLELPASERSNDEANAVDQQFARYTLEWLGFADAQLDYNLTQTGSRENRPDYIARGPVGTAFVWEDKNTTLDLEPKHIQQMRRYCIGTAGYAVWCNMKRIVAMRFAANDITDAESLVNVNVEALFGAQTVAEEFRQSQIANLELFQLLFSHARFFQFASLAASIASDEATFGAKAIHLTTDGTLEPFIAGSRESLGHLRLAALTRIRAALAGQQEASVTQTRLLSEWQDALEELLSNFHFRQEIVAQALAALKPGESSKQDVEQIETALVEAQGRLLSPALRTQFEKWKESALRISSVLYSLRFQSSGRLLVAHAYQVWSDLQTDALDIKPEVFAEQVAYVFFVRMLLVRVLEDKQVLRPRMASDGGFQVWLDYVRRQFQELESVSIVGDIYCNMLTRKAGNYYLHFFQQPVFDWFVPDDFLLLETLEFLCRYSFADIASDVIGFTYENYIERVARGRKGHFLTRPRVVEYMLDLLGYSGVGVIGRSLLDPACGSGSFLVHAAVRYRRALVTSICRREHLPDDEEAIDARPELRLELARRFVEDLIRLFHGMELLPFACYLAEMNLLIQALDDLAVLQRAGQSFPIDRFNLVNTDSLELPRDVLADPHVSGQAFAIPDTLNERLADEAYPMKARTNGFVAGFQYVVSNPPYVTSKREELAAERYRHTPFYETALSGDLNLYLLFLKLGMYYLAEFGSMVFIVPLTIFGDPSAKAARNLLRTPPFAPSAAVRFYRGDVLFPGVDQAVGIVAVQHSIQTQTVVVGGGNDTPDAQASHSRIPAASIVDAVPQNGTWNGAWLVSSDPTDAAIWQQAKSVSNDLAFTLGTLISQTFADFRQGDVNATHLNPLRVRGRTGSYAQGDVAIYKGENADLFAPLPVVPANWARPLTPGSSAGVLTATITASRNLTAVQQLPVRERGIILRQVARLNTRDTLIATWFEREATHPIAFTNELWRISLAPSSNVQTGQALLALIVSKPIAYLINLFSTNNHVGKEELYRVPVPDPDTLPIAELADVADQLLRVRAELETNYVTRYKAVLPGSENGTVYLPPSAVLNATTLPKLTLGDLTARGEVINRGAANQRVLTLHQRQRVVSGVDEEQPYAADFARALSLFLEEWSRSGLTWTQAQSRQMPEPIAASKWLTTYNALVQEAQQRWTRFGELQRAADKIVCDWYGFDDTMQTAIANGVAWARRRDATLDPSTIEAV